jgi:hypothetical protein
MLRRNGEVEGMLGPRRQSLWRKASGGDPHGPRSGERGGDRRKFRR